MSQREPFPTPPPRCHACFNHEAHCSCNTPPPLDTITPSGLVIPESATLTRDEPFVGLYL